VFRVPPKWYPAHASLRKSRTEILCDSPRRRPWTPAGQFCRLGRDVTADFRPGTHEWGFGDADIKSVLEWIEPRLGAS